ncbi:MAG: hypothetical protein ACE362_04995 [Phaeodactylibacter xiamenensis]|uniref:Uncharacterized protein n=1 Tax=Phaeodactylibacter xiamenensis TaxID=1524460 RepID=A0A098S0C5_9BACT|nr:hypothetical protein [Phaeodactylibacter xiamenensis]KGE85590.1 hypothetical protein IX84_26190 [Phaeodactylibacter xiamenensis]
MTYRITTLLLFLFLLNSCTEEAKKSSPLPQLSGIYPHLAYYNNEGECGTGAVVPWADRLWVITYGPHLPNGSSDQLYEITPDLEQIVRKESIGGTPANRMIHPESQQLFIGPYAIDQQGQVRTIPYPQMPGRHTGNARHLEQPEDKIYYGTMEEGFYEVDVHSLEVKELYEDANGLKGDQYSTLLPGAHGKGLYSGQGVLVYSNNGEPSEEALKQFDIPSGVLAEWNGKDWKTVRRAQFVEVTGPGGINGNENPETDPIWATGWDHKSVLLGTRDAKTGWSFYRLPKASHSYDGAHGWNTEWPRIRDVGTEGQPDYLMTMHGMFWRFPKTFTAGNSAGVRPRSAYLKVIGDFARWKDQLVFGCDDSAKKEFLNKRKVKGGIEGPGQSNVLGGLLYGLGDNSRSLGVAATNFSGTQADDYRYYELNEKLELQPKEDPKTLDFITGQFAIPKNVVMVEESSVLVVDDSGRRWQFPLGDPKFSELTNAGVLRIAREVATERDLLNLHGTFYELPAENADGFAKVRPVASHNFRIHDYASYRGLLVMTGIDPAAGKGNEHMIVSGDEQAAVWAGAIDDLWQLGKPTGQGGPWKNTEVEAGVPSDPYLIGFYDRRSLELSHQSAEPVTFTIEVEPIGHGPWMEYQRVTVAPGETYTHEFPDEFQARWIRFMADQNTSVSAFLEYK